MPAPSSRLSKRAHARIALRKKKNANAAKEVIEISTAASSSPTGVNNFVSDFNSNGGDKRCDDTSSVENVNRKSIVVEQKGTPVTNNTSYFRKSNDDDDNDGDDNATAFADDESRSITVQNSSIITTKSIGKNISDGKDSKHKHEDDSPTKSQININVTTRKYHEPVKAKDAQSIAIDNSFQWKKKNMFEDEMTVESSLNVSRLPDEGFVDKIEGFFLNGIEGIEDRLSCVPACITPDGTGGCQLFDPFDV